MKKIKLFIIQILLFSCLIISNSFSKALPPGSGVADVPANVLILLDKSGSMSVTQTIGANIGNPYLLHRYQILEIILRIMIQDLLGLITQQMQKHLLCRQETRIEFVNGDLSAQHIIIVVE